MAGQPPPDEEDLLAEALLAPADATELLPPPPEGSGTDVAPPPSEAFSSARESEPLVPTSPAPLEAENEALRRSLVALARHAHQSDPGHEDEFERCGHPMCRDVRALLPPEILPAEPETAPPPPAATPPTVPIPHAPPPSAADDSLLDVFAQPEPQEPPVAAAPAGVDAFTPPSQVAAAEPEPADHGAPWAVDEDVEPPPPRRPATRSRGFADTTADAIDRVATRLFGRRRRR